MAARRLWRGHLRLALVSCPVALYSARHENGSVQASMVDAKTGTDGRGRHLPARGGNLDSGRIVNQSVMEIRKFVDAGAIDPVYYDESYYLVPDGNGAEDVYAVLREAMARREKVALTHVMSSGRERTMVLRPMAGGIVAHALVEERDLNAPDSYFEQVRNLNVDQEFVALAEQIVERQSGDFGPSELTGHHETREDIPDIQLHPNSGAADEYTLYEDTNVIDLMAALRTSLTRPQPIPIARDATWETKPVKRRGDADQPGRKPEDGQTGKFAATADDVRSVATELLTFVGALRSDESEAIVASVARTSEGRAAVLSGVDLVLASMGDIDPWQKLDILLSPAEKVGQRPVELLLRGDRVGALALASRAASRFTPVAEIGKPSVSEAMDDDLEADLRRDRQLDMLDPSVST